MNTQLDPHGEMLLQQFRERLPELQQLEQKATDVLSSVLREQGIYVTGIEHRLKSEESLVGKLVRKGAKYQSIDDITDLVGLRVITFYASEVDKVAAMLASVFTIDWSNSVDKRKLHDLTSFGYNSLHYICELKEGSMRFELQIRTALQHVWSTIEHDIGYKSIVKIPPEFRRQFSRLASMLELIDDEFSRLRSAMTDYQRHIKKLVRNGRLDEVSLSVDSFQNYLETHPFRRLNQRIAEVNQAELYPALLTNFVPLLESFGFETLSDVQHFIDENSEDAFQLALSQLAATDLDILSESIGLQNLCLVHVLKQGEGRSGLKRVYDTIVGKSDDRSAILADMTMEQAKRMPFVRNID